MSQVSLSATEEVEVAFGTIERELKAIRLNNHSEITSYQRDVIERGHIPGVLSGGELRGKASSYGASYERTRNLIRAIIFRLYGVEDEVVYLADRSRYARVWVKRRPNNEVCPVRLIRAD